MTAFELLILALAIPGAVVALRDVCVRHALLDDAAYARDKRARRDATHSRAALPRTIELAISVRFQIAGVRGGLDRLREVEPHTVRPPASTERAHADES